MTEPPAQHPWAKYYAERGAARPPMAALVRPASVRARKKNGGARANVATPPAGPMSAELAAAVAAVATHGVGVNTAAPFITAMQREAMAQEAKRQARLRYAKIAAIAAAVVILLHVAVTRIFWQAPSASALEARVQALPDAVLSLFSSVRQPLQIDNVAIAQADRIDGGHYRYVAAVTLRLRKPLYVPAVTNGTATYRRLQEAVDRSRDQQMRLKLSLDADTPEPAPLPMLLRRVHQAGESIVVRVPFHARRFGWRWRIEDAQLALRIANRALEGDSLDRYAGTPYLIFGDASTLAEIRRRTKLANTYVLAVAKEIQRHANGEATSEATGATGLADLPAVELAHLPAAAAEPALADKPAELESLPSVNPDAPAVFLPEPVRFVTTPPRTTAR